MRGKPGTCNPQKDGYVRRTINGIRKLDHVWVWEKHFGPVPRGHHIHHKNGVRHDNRIENLEVMKPLDHKRKHVGYRKNKKGEWLKPCATCKKHLPLSKYYQHDQFKPRPQHECKDCCVLSNMLRRNKKKLETAKNQIAVLEAKLERRRR